MAYIQGEGRSQGSLFPVVLDDFIPVDHMCRVIDAFVARLALSELGFERAQAAETGRPGYDPRDLLKLYLYGYLNQIRSSRRLEAECRRNVELMWLLGRLYPDHKSISEFRRMHCDAVTAAGRPHSLCTELWSYPWRVDRYRRVEVSRCGQRRQHPRTAGPTTLSRQHRESGRRATSKYRPVRRTGCAREVEATS